MLYLLTRREKHQKLSKNGLRGTISNNTRHTAKIKTSNGAEGPAAPSFKETLLGDAFRREGIPVYYSYGADNDDTLAAYAHRDSAAILSEDQDYFRYNGVDFKMYKDFSYKKGAIKLQESVSNGKRNSRRDVMLDPPLTITHSPDLADIGRGMYRVGPASPLLKFFPNPHLTARPIRQALYASLGITTPVKEIIPYWSGEAVVWTNDLVLPDPLYNAYLENPNMGLVELFAPVQFVRPDNIASNLWDSHLFACTAVVHNLTCLASRGAISLLDAMQPIADSFFDHEKSKGPIKHQFKCRVCQKTTKIHQKQFEWFKEMRMSMPKSCESCRHAKS